MRIVRLKILDRWKNLSGFEINFDSSRAITILIGRNGSAKSNLLEAIITIFRNIDLGIGAEFGFEVGYQIHGKTVEIASERGKQPKGLVNGESLPLAQIRQYWTPRFVVSYYSGVSDRLEKLFQSHDRRALEATLSRRNAIPAGERLELSRFICARPIHGRFSLLAYYFSNDGRAYQFLKEVTRIEAFDSVLLILKKPSWAGRSNSHSEGFWGATGPVQDLLRVIRKNSLAPFAFSTREKIDFKRSERREYQFLFLPNLKALHSVAKHYDRDARAFFQALETMRLSDLVADLRVRVKVRGLDGALQTRELSEGEQQILTVLGLMRFTRNAASLYLLDEPDTHINPAWELDYLHYLRTVGGVEKNSHTLLSTHDPLLVAGLLREEIRVLSRSEDGTISAYQPETHPRGTGVAGVLTSPLYGLPSQLDRFSLRVLKRVYDVSLQKPSKRRTRHLARLHALVPTLQSSETSPDPYRNIARAAYRLAQESITNSEDLTTSQKSQLIDKLARKLVKPPKPRR